MLHVVHTFLSISPLSSSSSPSSSSSSSPSSSSRVGAKGRRSSAKYTQCRWSLRPTIRPRIQKACVEDAREDISLTLYLSTRENRYFFFICLFILFSPFPFLSFYLSFFLSTFLSLENNGYGIKERSGWGWINNIVYPAEKIKPGRSIASSLWIKALPSIPFIAFHPPLPC